MNKITIDGELVIGHFYAELKPDDAISLDRAIFAQLCDQPELKSRRVKVTIEFEPEDKRPAVGSEIHYVGALGWDYVGTVVEHNLRQPNLYKVSWCCADGKTFETWEAIR